MDCLFFSLVFFIVEKFDLDVFLAPKLLRMMETGDRGLCEGWMDGWEGGRCIKGGRKTAGGGWKQQEKQDEVTPDRAAGSIDN